MNPDAPGAYAPPVDTHGSLIDAVHRAISQHPHPVQKASYGKMLAQLLADQARMHATPPAGGTDTAGGPRQPPNDTVPPDTGQIVTQNMSPLGWALANAGGTDNLFHSVQGLPGGWLASLLAGGRPHIPPVSSLY